MNQEIIQKENKITQNNMQFNWLTTLNTLP